MLRILAALASLVLLTGLSEPDRYVAGQVWEYRTRPADSGSLLKIQRVEQDPTLGPIFHISVIGLRLRNQDIDPVLSHTPVSLETLDASVTRLSTKGSTFPDPAEGIAEWRSARGGVFTITVAEIVELVDRQTSGGWPSPLPQRLPRQRMHPVLAQRRRHRRLREQARDGRVPHVQSAREGPERR